MGEITARRHVMAAEYSKLLRSYVMPHGNFLEHEILQRGVLWGLARLAAARPEHAAEAGPFLLPFLKSKDPIHRGLATLSTGAIANKTAVPYLKEMLEDNVTIRIYDDLAFKTVSVGRLAAEALKKIGVLA
jgi:HEAT repeat protein